MLRLASNHPKKILYQYHSIMDRIILTNLTKLTIPVLEVNLEVMEEIFNFPIVELILLNGVTQEVV